MNVILPPVTESLLVFSPYFFPLCDSASMASSCLAFSIYLHFCHVRSALNPASNIFNPRVFFWLLFIVFLFQLGVPILLLIVSIFSFKSLNIFAIAMLKSLIFNSKISIMPGSIQLIVLSPDYGCYLLVSVIHNIFIRICML